MPVRKVSQHGKNIIGLFPSVKLKRMVAYESLVECDTYFGLDYDGLVTYFEEQPRSITYLFGGKVHSYTPDVWKVCQGENILVECKPEKFVDSPENLVKFAAAREWCAGAGWRFEVVVAEQLRSGFRLKNIKLMTLYARHVVPSDFLAGARDRLVKGEMPIGELGKQLAGNGQTAWAWLLCLAFHHDIEIEVDHGSIDEGSLVCLGGVV